MSPRMPLRISGKVVSVTADRHRLLRLVRDPCPRRRYSPHPPRRQPGPGRHPHRSAGRLWGRECKQMGFYSYLTRVPCASPSPLGTKPPRRLLLLLLQLLPPPPLRYSPTTATPSPGALSTLTPYAPCGEDYTRVPAAGFTQCGAISSSSPPSPAASLPSPLLHHGLRKWRSACLRRPPPPPHSPSLPCGGLRSSLKRSGPGGGRAAGAGSGRQPRGGRAADPGFWEAPAVAVPPTPSASGGSSPQSAAAQRPQCPSGPRPTDSQAPGRAAGEAEPPPVARRWEGGLGLSAGRSAGSRACRWSRSRGRGRASAAAPAGGEPSWPPRWHGGKGSVRNKGVFRGSERRSRTEIPFRERDVYCPPFV